MPMPIGFLERLVHPVTSRGNAVAHPVLLPPLPRKSDFGRFDRCRAEAKLHGTFRGNAGVTRSERPETMGARHLLTDKQIQSAEPAPNGARTILWDAVIPSLGLRITDRGHKSFLVQRRVNGRMVKLTLGEYPALGLAAARQKAQDALADMTRGIDPRQVNQPSVTATGLRKDSFEGAVESYIKREVEKNRRPRTRQEIVRTLRKVLVPKWGTLPVRDIGPRHILDVLDEFMDADKPIMANRTYAILHRFFRWCIERHLITANPAANVRKPAKETTRSRVLDDDEIREVWTASARLGWPFGPFFQTLILTGQRRNEVAGMLWGDIDSENRQWMLPGAKTKNARDHVVPLAPAMRAILDAVPRFGDDDDEPEEEQRARPVFTTNGRTGISGFSRAKARLDADILATRRREAEAAGRDPEKIKPLPSWILHDLRRSCATGMGRLGIVPHIIETVLNHASGFRAGIVGVYQRHTYMEERRHALEVWAAHVVSLMAPQEPSHNVVAFKKNAR